MFCYNRREIVRCINAIYLEKNNKHKPVSTALSEIPSRELQYGRLVELTENPGFDHSISQR